jgi:hypothetical protein
MIVQLPHSMRELDMVAVADANVFHHPYAYAAYSEPAQLQAA